MALEVVVSGQSLSNANKPKPPEERNISFSETSRTCRKYTMLAMSWAGQVLIKAVVEKVSTLNDPIGITDRKPTNDIESFGQEPVSNS